MVDNISLKEAERNVFKMAVNDGLWDIFIGCFVLLFAVAPLLSNSLGDFWSTLIFLPFWALVFIVLSLVRKHVITPRIGIVNFGKYRKKKLTKFSYIMFIVNIVAFIVGTFFAINFSLKSGFMYMFFFGFIILIISSTASYFLNFARLSIYGLLFLISLFGGEWLFATYKTPNRGFPITFGITAGIIIVTGFTIFFRLIRKNPIPINESLPDESVSEMSE